MTRINTNVSSLVAQKTLARSNSDLQTALNRLSTGLRINTGKDDPAGLIASEVLRSDIVSVQRAITNSERANQLIATADSALGQVSSLLNDVRGLVSEAANTGALSEDQIKANQLQLDSSLEAIDRISQTTSFQGRRLLDGSLGFISTNAGDVAPTNAVGVIANGTTSSVRFSAASGGSAFNDFTIAIVRGNSGATATAAFDGAAKTLTFTVNSAATAASVLAAHNANASAAAAFSASVVSAGVVSASTATTSGGATFGGNLSDLKIDQANFGTASSINVTVDVDQQATQGALTYSGGTLTADLVLEIGGKNGFEVFNFGAGTTVNGIETALNLVSDATGVEASVVGTGISLQSSEYGSEAFVSAKAISGTFATLNGAAATSTREAGTDVSARINGVQATGRGLRAELNTSTLDLSFTVNEALTDSSNFSFSITGGGAIFQLGPDVVSNQQARLGIQGVSSATLGGVSGSLFELRSGGAKDLTTDVKGAAKVIDEVISAVTGLRGRLGAFQKTTLETNIASLGDTLENLTDAESSIRDADFAAESAALTRAQILVQAGTAVLQIANQNPQNVLALLQ